jgi:ribose/xylose/arabinose/galactoside ABC-type transport system permease subunit
MIASLVGLITFGLAYGFYNGKNKMGVAALIGIIALVIVFALLYFVKPQVGDPFSAFVPHTTDCAKATAGAWLPFDRWGCDIGNSFEMFKWLGAMIVAAIVAYFAFGFFNRILPENKPLVIAITSIVFVIVFLITAAVFWIALILAIIFGLIAGFVKGFIPAPIRVDNSSGGRSWSIRRRRNNSQN